MSHGVDTLQLLVEVPPAGLPNLIKNPSGELGAWGWDTPNDDQALTSDPDVDGPALRFTNNHLPTTESTSMYWLTDYVPVAAGEWVQGRFDLLATRDANAVVYCSVYFYDGTRAYLGNSGYSDDKGAPQTVFSPRTAAPAGAAYARLYFTLTGARNMSTGASGPYLGNGAWCRFRNVMLTKTSNSLNLGPNRRTNRVLNASAAIGFAGSTYWQDGWTVNNAGGVLARATGISTPSTVAACWRVSQGTVANPIATYAGTTVTAGTWYSVSGYLATSRAGNLGRLRLQWFNASNVQVGATVASATQSLTTTGTGWKRFQLPNHAPAGATTVRLLFDTTNGVVGNGDFLFVDALLVEAVSGAGDVAGDWFNGWAPQNPIALPNARTFVFLDGASGTFVPNQRMSQETVSYFGYVEPYAWQNILGASSSIQVVRKALDVGTLVATLLDPAYDPSLPGNQLHPGAVVRLLAKTDSAIGWDELFTGELQKAGSTYTRKRGGELQTVTVLTALDATAKLAGVLEPRAVGNRPQDLPALLESTRVSRWDEGDGTVNNVPWNVNGNTGQVVAYTQTATVDNASLLDQITLTRDCVLGLAYVDRVGVLQFKTAPSLAPVILLTDDADELAAAAGPKLSYTTPTVTYSTDDLVNSYVVHFLRWKKDGTTETIDYGPYADDASVAQWGAYQGELTFSATTEDPAAIEALATSALAKSATPQLRVSQLGIVVPDSNVGRRYVVKQLDVGQVAHVKFAGRLDANLRVDGVEHNLQARAGAAETWHSVVRFAEADGAPAQQVTPRPSRPIVKDSGWTDGTPQSGTAMFTASAGVNYLQYRRVGQVVHVRFSRNLDSVNDMSANASSDFGNQTVFGAGSLPDEALPSFAVQGMARAAADRLTQVSLTTTGGIVWQGGYPSSYAAGSTITGDFVFLVDN